LTSGFDLGNFRSLLLDGVQRGGTLFVPIEKWGR